MVAIEIEKTFGRDTNTEDIWSRYKYRRHLVKIEIEKTIGRDTNIEGI